MNDAIKNNERASQMPSKKIGRPTDYTPELAEEICDAIASTSIGLRKLCKENEHWPDAVNIYRWLKKHDEFRNQYAQAKQYQVETLIDEILEIADDTTNDTVIKIDNEGNGKEICNSEYINRSRLRVDTRKWLAAKLCLRIYGNIDIAPTEMQSLMEKLIDKL